MVLLYSPQQQNLNTNSGGPIQSPGQQQQNLNTNSGGPIQSPGQQQQNLNTNGGGPTLPVLGLLYDLFQIKLAHNLN
ncbi:MAG: hypothetical protein ACTHKF_06235 [Candidatus Nitrosocosmicus sp.]